MKLILLIILTSNIFGSECKLVLKNDNNNQCLAQTSNISKKISFNLCCNSFLDDESNFISNYKSALEKKEVSIINSLLESSSNNIISMHLQSIKNKFKNKEYVVPKFKLNELTKAFVEHSDYSLTGIFPLNVDDNKVLVNKLDIFLAIQNDFKILKKYY